MPAVDISKNMTPGASSGTLNIEEDTPPAAGDGDGQARIVCTPSHMSNDDPIVYPNQQGAAHHHTFFGNASVNYKTNPSTLSSVGNGTCQGGTANRSAYWVPSMIDTATKTPIAPWHGVWYYKTGYTVPHKLITAPPEGLRIIAGNSKSAVTQDDGIVWFSCTNGNGDGIGVYTDHIPACTKGKILGTHVRFPQCWDGKNLDSPDHKSHMAYASSNYPTANRCPTTHPVPIPELSLNIRYKVNTNDTSSWRLASDNYTASGQNAGNSSHADWIMGWDKTSMDSIIKNCLNAGKDCDTGGLGNSTRLMNIDY